MSPNLMDTPEEVGRILLQLDLLPPGSVCSELEPRRVNLSLPGERDAARVTADPDIFDDHFESHQLVLPDGPLFRQLASAADGAEPNAAAGTPSLKDLLR